MDETSSRQSSLVARQRRRRRSPLLLVCIFLMGAAAFSVWFSSLKSGYFCLYWILRCLCSDKHNNLGAASAITSRALICSAFIGNTFRGVLYPVPYTPPAVPAALPTRGNSTLCQWGQTSPSVRPRRFKDEMGETYLLRREILLCSTVRRKQPD